MVGMLGLAIMWGLWTLDRASSSFCFFRKKRQLEDGNGYSHPLTNYIFPQAWISPCCVMVANYYLFGLLREADSRALYALFYI